ncbi:Membrane protein involved in the export of O-antigen and teichoic acid [Catalinimonas alkaloidigena]|uniref:Membrane protein involved in the export of O-antigen and teichoic acid n=1 Tax=Catalinimonas alkaloidigena TaxID=1075417 RepID=A0A1G9ASK0_9BACT|nr:polysaccharide biosynthesis C-terminal domain-containing protein [Catalinimonas alkaloidigena]SDK29610.1 Membrane protein involved in the export of O-antigen and teichoic acid [Catalinimonas alkaloidigena]
MLRNIIGTFATKVITAGLNFIIVLLTTHYLGAEGRGEISLLVANITLIVLICNVVGGPSLVYMASRHQPFQLALPSLLWALLTPLWTGAGLVLADQVPAGLEMHLMLLAGIEGVYSVSMMLILGWNLIRTHNLIMLGRGFVLFVVLLSLFYVQQPQVMHYIWALYAGSGMVLLVSSVVVFPYFKEISFRSFKSTFRAVVRTGATAQFSNILQFFNYRISYYFLNYFADTRSVGIYSAGVMLSESIWLVTRSVASVQYAEGVNTDDAQKAVQVAFRLARLCFLASLVLLFPLLLLPDSVLTWIFGRDFGDVGGVIRSLAIGTLSVSVSTVLCTYFSGQGRFYVNNWVAGIGFIALLPACFLLIPRWHVLGAGWANSLAYLASLVYVWITFRRETGFRITHLLPTAADWRLVRAFLRRS